MISLSTAMTETGAAAQLADGLVDSSAPGRRSCWVSSS